MGLQHAAETNALKQRLEAMQVALHAEMNDKADLNRSLIREREHGNELKRELTAQNKEVEDLNRRVALLSSAQNELELRFSTFFS